MARYNVKLTKEQDKSLKAVADFYDLPSKAQAIRRALTILTLLQREGLKTLKIKGKDNVEKEIIIND